MKKWNVRRSATGMNVAREWTVMEWRVRVGRVCAHRMCMNEEQCGYKGEGVHSHVGLVWEMCSHTCVGE